MNCVLIISDTTFGKIIGKYSRSESLYVCHAERLSTAECGAHRPNVIVVDLSFELVGEETFCNEAFVRFGCTSFIMIRPMEQESKEEESERNLTFHIDSIVKPIRLAELKYLIYSQVAPQK